MDIPNEILEKLKCSKCGVYLSRVPVYLQHNGAALCGRCFTPDLPATRISQYEAVASLLRFPCKFSEFGCGDTVPYIQEDEVIAHEEVCAHRQWMCPVLGSACCDWLGSRADILQHCQDQHPDRVLDNPCHLEHDITKSSERTFLLRAFKLNFLLHTKICVLSAKMYHSVLHIGDSDSAAKFKFIVDIKRNERSISLPGDVAPQGCLAIQEDTSLVLDINGLLSVLGEFAGASFTVEVKRRVREAVKVCTGCEVQRAVVVYRGESGWKCERCAPARRACDNQTQGCSHRDIDMKCYKHEVYFCQQRTQCRVCDADVARGSLSAHYNCACRKVCRVGSTWRVTQTSWQWSLVSGAAGTSVCLYSLHDTMFDLCVYSPVSSERLREFGCVVRVAQPATGLVRTYTPDALYNGMCDWNIELRREEFPSWDCQFDVSVNITKIDT